VKQQHEVPECEQITLAQASILSLGTESRAWRLAASDWARQVWAAYPPRLRPSFVTSVDARVVSVDRRGNWW
jgi:hypothetical protein